MTSNLRQEVLKIYRTLHRTKNLVFKGDETALLAARNKINEEFKKNKNKTDVEEIEKMIKTSHEVERLLRVNVVQASEKKTGVYELQLRPGVELSDNVPYTGPTVGIEELDESRTKKSCQQQAVETSKG